MVICTIKNLRRILSFNGKIYFMRLCLPLRKKRSSTKRLQISLSTSHSFQNFRQLGKWEQLRLWVREILFDWFYRSQISFALVQSSSVVLNRGAAAHKGAASFHFHWHLDLFLASRGASKKWYCQPRGQRGKKGWETLDLASCQVIWFIC